MSRGTKTILWILVLVVVTAVFVWRGRGRLQKDEVLSIDDVQVEQGIPVDVVSVPLGTLEDWRRFTGEVEGWEQVNIISEFRTRIESVHARLGENLAAGALVVKLDPNDPMRVSMNLDAAKAQYMSARADSQRMEALYEQGAVSLQQVEHVKTQISAARAFWLGASQAVELRTPIRGVVTALSAEPDRYVEAGGVLATVASMERIRVRVSLSVDERMQVAEGQPARIALADGSILNGRVYKVSLSADSETRLYATELSFDISGLDLRPGTLVTTEIRVEHSSESPLLPSAALIRRNGRTFCYLVEGGDESRVVERDLVTGIDTGRLFSIESGLAEGDKVVVAGKSKLVDGIKVKVRADLSETLYGARR